ncbi:Uncharacterised protein [Sphingobacterium thalpophilum]|uniref:Uncharacterized protein n=1 Tax=Sphingobacterium thalpophilum TaxID=259 RepID=A0A4U9VE32_9SPHI|nr:Uncharacterised protein [Sphingobacterium thalpophilum]
MRFEPKEAQGCSLGDAGLSQSCHPDIKALTKVRAFFVSKQEEDLRPFMVYEV